MNELQLVIESLQKEVAKLRSSLEKVSKKSKARRNALKDLQRAYIITQQALELTVARNIRLIQEKKNLIKDDILYIKDNASWWKFWGK